MSENVRKNALTPRQLKAVSCLLEGATMRETAVCVGVNEKTISRWLCQPEFTRQLKAGETVVLERVSRRLVGLAERAVTVLGELLDNPGVAGAGVRRLTAVNLLELTQAYRELNEFERRLLELEKAVLHETH